KSKRRSSGEGDLTALFGAAASQVRAIESPYRAFTQLTHVIPRPYVALPTAAASVAPSLQSLVPPREDPATLFTNVKKIGEGTFGEVFVGVHVDSLEKFAIKKLPLETNYEEDL